MAFAGDAKWLRVSSLAVAAAAFAVVSVTAAIVSVSISCRRSKRMASVIRDLEECLEASREKRSAERRGRVRAQEALRRALAQQRSDVARALRPPDALHYPMVPIGTVQSCFSNRYGTPRQPLLVPLARARVVFDQARVPPHALEGLASYSHCWILYVFHLNTNLDKLWKDPARSKLKSKVRVPKLKGGKVGVLATRSPHRPCPIGLTVAKIEAVTQHGVLLSGVDLVDGTPVLDIKPYLPYADSVQNATIPDWVKVDDILTVASVTFSVDFLSTLSDCWAVAEKHSMYSSMEEFKSLIKEVLFWDIRSLNQRNLCGGADSNEDSGETNISNTSSDALTYLLVLEGIDISYKIDDESNIIVETATLGATAEKTAKSRRNYAIWRDVIAEFDHEMNSRILGR